METFAQWILNILLLIGFGSWAVAFYSQIGVFRNMGAGFWNVMLHSHWLLFNKEKLQLNEAGERYHERLLQSGKIFFLCVVGSMVIMAVLIGIKDN